MRSMAGANWAVRSSATLDDVVKDDAAVVVDDLSLVTGLHRAVVALRRCSHRSAGYPTDNFVLHYMGATGSQVGAEARMHDRKHLACGRHGPVPGRPR